MNRGKIKVNDGDKLLIVTEIHGEETIDLFSFEEIQNFITTSTTKGNPHD